MFESKPYRIIPKIQNYEWGTKNKQAIIPKFLGIKTEQNLPYAELWFGTHPKNPSEILIDNQKYNLDEIIKKYPKEILGKEISNKFSMNLPFLLKILSIGRALSIQTHPNKKTASILHKNDPKNYPDSNHKPEIAIAIDNLNAIVGLKNIEKIRSSFNQYPELKNLINSKTLKILFNKSEKENKNLIKRIYSEIMSVEKSKLDPVIISLVDLLKTKKKKNFIENTFLNEYKNYGSDVGLISLFLFNHIDLKKGNAIFTPAGIPHAYLKGNIVECMANSDNVVRAGLTNKFKDISTLTKILEADSNKTKVAKIKRKNKIVYKTSAEEFQIEFIFFDKNNNSNIFLNSSTNILLIMKGKVQISWGENKISYKKGDAFLIPASMNKFKLSSNINSEIYRVLVP